MNHSVLIVDDEPSIRSGLSSYHWEALGFSVVAALADGKQALAYVLSHRVDVVLCDIRMPVMDGIAFAKEVWERKLGLTIIFLTGFKDMEYIRLAMRYGCRDYLLKPTRFRQLEELFSHLKHELDQKQQNAGFLLSDDDAVIRAAKTYILTHLDSVSLESISSYLQLSPSYVSKLFKDRTSMHFSDYCQQERMNLAKRLLSDHRTQIQDIALQTGYSNAANFARAFKAQFGYAPTEYREQGMTHIDKN